MQINQEEAVMNTDVTFIAPATPSQQEGSINLQFIENSPRKIGKAAFRPVL